MRIKRLELRGFRRHAHLDLDLAPGLTVVRGPNEAGKTTLQRALELGLTRRVTSASADMELLRTWGSSTADGSAPEFVMEFEQDDEDTLKVGSLHKAFRGAKGTVRLDYDGESITDPALVDQRLADLTGIPTEAFFRSTASVRHHEVDDLARDEAALRDRLQASISGGDRGTSRARKLLDRAIRDLNSRGAKSPGRLRSAEIAVESTRTDVEQGERALVQLERDRVVQSEAVERRTAAILELDTRRSMLEKARQAERLDAERTSASERFERYRSAASVIAQTKKLQATHPTNIPLANLRLAVEGLRLVDGRVRELKAQLAGEVETNFEPPPPPRSWKWAMVASSLAIVAGLVLGLVAGVVVGQVWARFPGAVVALGGVALLVVSGVMQRRYNRLQKTHDQIEFDVDRRLRGRSQMQQELIDEELAEARLLAELELLDLAAAEDILNRETAHVSEIDQRIAELRGLVGDMRPEAVAPERNTAALEVERKTHALEELGPIAREPRARERLEVEVREAEAQAEAAREGEAQARARVEANGVDAEEVAARAERLATWEEQLAALKRRDRVYATTLAAIEEAERATMRTATRYLEHTMVADIDRITGGRYRRVRVDDQTRGIEVFAPERNDWVDVSTLSQGTVDLIYLAARLGLVRLVTGDRRPPLVFDDPFVTLDDERAARAVELLRELARDFQVIYLTTSARYDHAADAVRILDGPTAQDEGAPAAEAPAVAPAPTRAPGAADQVRSAREARPESATPVDPAPAD